MKNRTKQMGDMKERIPLSLQMRQRLREGMFIVIVACAIFLTISLMTYHVTDPGWSSTGLGSQVSNWGGKVGAWLADVFLSLFGYVAYIFPVMITITSWLMINERVEIEKRHLERVITAFGWLILIISACALAGFYMRVHSALPARSGGIMGDLLDSLAAAVFNQSGSTLVFITLLLCGITFVSGFSWLAVVERVGERVHTGCGYVIRERKSIFATLMRRANPQAEPENRQPREFVQRAIARDSNETTTAVQMAPKAIAATPKPVIMPHQQEPLRERKKVEIGPVPKMKPGTLPPISLLNPVPPAAGKAFNNIGFEELSVLVEQRLSDFGVDVKVTAVHPGPVITRFELELAPGVKVSKISGLSKDIARSLSAVSVRIVDVIPGKSVIGLEIPNENREVVSLRDMIESQRYIQSRSPVSIVLGKDTSGNPIVADLSKMPHLLVAGTTGSGKSVSLNAMLLSMLYKATPDQLRLILIDPKMLELSIYDGIPHLLTPVITDMKDASNALRWCVAEMDKRYRLMAALGVRNLAGYNQKVTDAIKQGQPLPMPGVLVTDEESAKATLEPMPLVVVVADELADMMMVVGKKIEDLIARIAQKARAAGIHLIIATQRPSVDVITGLIKANIPTRMAFQVSSRIDSRTILDQQGAEQLLGHGDMLYLPPGAGVPIRVHGAYVADEEVHRVVAAWRSYGQPEYIYSITEEAGENMGGSEAGQGSGEQDALYDEAVRIVTESRRASISLVQRRLRIGYNRAARMMEEMEAAGVVSTMDNNGTREVLAAAPVSVD